MSPEDTKITPSPTQTYTPFMALHAGAGYHSPQSEPVLNALLTHALHQALKILTAPPPNNTSLQALTTALRILEDSPHTNAGTGSHLTLSGTVECDASIMDGSDGSFGAVAAVSGVKNPVMGAVSVMEADKGGPGLLGRVPPLMVCGDGARKWCLERGVEVVDGESMVTGEARGKWEKYMGYLEEAEGEAERGRSLPFEEKATSQSRKRSASPSPPTTTPPPHKKPRQTSNLPPPSSTINDTIGAIALDTTGTIHSAVSSGGIALKHPGRIGEAALYGAGTWARNPSRTTPGIGISISGTGEQISRTLFAKMLADKFTDRTISTTDVAGVLRSVVEEEFLGGRGMERYDVRERNLGILMLRVVDASDEGDGEKGSGSESSVDDEEKGDLHDGEASCELWYAHTTESFSVGWVSARDCKPVVKMSRRKGRRSVVIEGRPV
ncbi:taspase, threonine aspartase, 1 [Rhizophlyctis rosea]|nr:taspase, threonine aspartase, 1 [Rhizophlyctis rosea]